MEDRSQLSLLQHSQVPLTEPDHADRLEGWHKRMAKFAEHTRLLSNYLSNSAVVVELGPDQSFHTFQCQVSEPVEDCGMLTRGATRYCHQRKALYRGRLAGCRVYNLALVQDTATLDIVRAVRIQSYFAAQLPYLFLTLYPILKRDHTLSVFHYRFPASNLYHRVCGALTAEPKLVEVKRWTKQLANAAEAMSLAGVAHRFLRPENVLLTSDEVVKVAAFDAATLVWDGPGRPVGHRRGLPPDVATVDLWDHLPPECFADHYDASMVDVWSVGVVVVQLLQAVHPFDPGDPDRLVQHWHTSGQRTRMPDEVRSLLDDVFKPAHERLTLYDLCRDRRLHAPPSSTASRQVTSGVRPYYRIDLNPTEPPSPVASVPANPRQVSASNYSRTCLQAFQLKAHRSVTSEEAMAALPDHKHYQVLRNQSFDRECDRVGRIDRFLKCSVQCTSGDPTSTGVGLRRCWAKIISLRELPTRHRNILYGESVRVMAFLSRAGCPFMHTVEDIFLTKSQKLYLFFADLCDGGRTLADVGDTVRLNDGQQTTVFAQLASAIDFLTYNGIAHRYVRPEFVLLALSPSAAIKLTHFDMSCFTWNPIRSVQVYRSYGLQDCQEHRWRHLPPECFQAKYEPTLVDVWSFGVVVVCCLTAGVSPFTSVPHTDETAVDRWTVFKDRHSTPLARYVSLLDCIFVPAERRIHSDRLVRAFRAVEPQQQQHTSNTHPN